MIEVNFGAIKNNLRVIKKPIVGLVALGMTTLTLTACGSSKGFDYVHDSDSYATQYVTYLEDNSLEVNVSDELLNDLDDLGDIIDAFDDYEALETKKKEDKTLVVSNGRDGLKKLDEIVCDRIKDEANLEDAKVKIKDGGNSKDGPSYVVVIEKDGVIQETELPDSLFNWVNQIHDGELTTYKGSGENWSDEDIEKFGKKLEKLSEGVTTAVAQPIDLKLENGKNFAK